MESKTITTAAVLPMLVLAVALGAGTVAADPPAQLEADDAIAQLDETQEAADSLNETEDQENELVYQFDNGGELVNVRFEENIAYVTLRATNTPRRFWLSEAAMEGSGSFSFKNVRVLPGAPVTVKMPVETNAITVTSGNDGYYYEGDIGLTVITSTPTTELVQISAISGIIGSVIALAIVIGQLRRKHENSYKELFSEERHEIQSEPVEVDSNPLAVDSIVSFNFNRTSPILVDSHLSRSGSRRQYLQHSRYSSLPQHRCRLHCEL